MSLMRKLFRAVLGVIKRACVEYIHRFSFIFLKKEEPRDAILFLEWNSFAFLHSE